MNKEYLKALKFIFDEALFSEFKNETHTKVRECHSIVYEALKRLEAIDNASPSEALEGLKYLGSFNLETDILVVQTKAYNTIEQALIKAQEQEDKAKAFDLINEKRVDIKTLHWAYPNVEAYNVWVRENNKTFWRKELTPEEFEFIGRLTGAK